MEQSPVAAAVEALWNLSLLLRGQRAEQVFDRGAFVETWVNDWFDHCHAAFHAPQTCSGMMEESGTQIAVVEPPLLYTNGVTVPLEACSP